ncbi:xyloglucan O-acetyltransferase 1-like [Nicotiana tabacum]|uniref:Protein ALTERED XYLOGLUCAN 4-like n=2 Tax=Nicotiana TaxID=4085 RepID=A0A1S3YIY9_TOBAC|nr:PREDICTED: protein ALTERED XYLOGLUCAN 4 [Nicotiana sylvestris]XP_016452204.1 PREDICTED: protein ALTERED XYLOGLUCAN 4-like [Nicotiana tabacum]
MDTISPFKDQPHHFPLRKLLLLALYALLPIILLFHLIGPLSLSQTKHSLIITTSSTPSKEVGNDNVENSCDYSDGKWVHDKLGPLYTKCGTVKEGQNCIPHGRPDKGYLYWKWKPKNCQLPRFDPKLFLQILKNKNLAFVGDSLARNQLESLLCMLATASPPTLVFSHGEDNKFRKWHFPSHNVNVSIYWSPFLVKGIEKSDKKNYNTLFLDSVDEKWASDLGQLDMIVLSVGHWFLHSAVYYYGDSVLGCHYCSGQNYTEIGFYDVYGKAYRTTLNTIIERRGNNNNKGNRGILDVIVTTFSPAHFEGEWDKLGACPKTQPYNPEEKKLEWMDEQMRETAINQVNVAKKEAENLSNVRIEAVDVTKLALLRPDGHPGPYMHPFPFANGIEERVQNDCVHWCLPGPIDTWNEILLQVIKNWTG